MRYGTTYLLDKVDCTLKRVLLAILNNLATELNLNLKGVHTKVANLDEH